jgi:hypothetical protein
MGSKDFFKVPLNYLKCIGFLPKYEDSRSGKMWHFYTMITFLLMFVSITFQVHSLVQSFENLDDFLTNIGTITQIAFLTIKLLTFYLQRETFNSLMEDLVNLTDKGENWGLKNC